MTNNELREDVLSKYKLAGKIRFVTFSLLLLFSLLMKFIGGYSYLNITFVGLILVEAVFNQPYKFLVKRVNLNRFQYYRMAVDIIAISWIIYYMGGIQAPLVSLAYYGVILWAGFVSTTGAVFFATCASVFLFSLMALLEHFGFLLFPSYYEYKVTTSHMLSLLLGNVAFLFAFGYFSANSSRVIKRLERRRYEDSLRHAHRFSEVNYLVGYIVHDALNQMINIEGYSMSDSEELYGDSLAQPVLWKNGSDLSELSGKPIRLRN